MIIEFTSVKTLIAKIYRDLNIQDEMRFDAMLEWAVEALEDIGAYSSLQRAQAEFDITDHILELPCDVYKIGNVSMNNVPLVYSEAVRQTIKEVNDGGSINPLSASWYPNNYYYNEKPSWWIDPPFLRFSLKAGKVHINYLKERLDEDGNPLIPNTFAFMDAIKAYILVRLKEPEWYIGTLSDAQFRQMEMRWANKKMKARGEANMMSIDELESFKNQWLRLIPNPNHHSNFFRTLTAGQVLKM